jgi:ABC-2 type transport system permease protein
MSKGNEASVLKKSEGPNYVTRLLSYLLIFLPATLSFLYVRAFGVDVPIGDTWTMVPFFDKLSSGTLTFSSLWHQHMEHRVFFPRIAMLLLGSITSFNNVAIMYLIQSCFLVTLIAILLAFKANTRANLLLFVPIAFLIFSLGQYWNMLVAWSLTFVFVQTFAVLAFYLIYISSRTGFGKRALSAALVSGTVATFSSAQGLLVWPAGLLQLLIAPVERSTKKILVGIWGVAGLVEWIVYFYDWNIPDFQMAHHSERYFLDNPNLGIDYFLTALGSSLIRLQTVALMSGLLLICLVAATLFLVYRAGLLGECSFWITLISFSFLFLGSIMVGRSGMGLENALSSKYPTFTVLAVIGAYVILIKLALEQRTRIIYALLSCLTALIIVSVPISYMVGIDAGKAFNARTERAAYIISNYETKPDGALTIVNRAAWRVREWAPILERLNYTVFARSEKQN